MDKTIYKISSLIYLLIFFICLVLYFQTEHDNSFQLILLAFVLFASVVLGIFGFTNAEITPTSKAHIYMTLFATALILLFAISMSIHCRNGCQSEEGMGIAPVFILLILIFAIAQLIGLVSLIGLGITYLKK